MTTELLVCVKCRKGQDIPEDATRPGQALMEALAAGDLPDGVRLRAVECLQNCDQGCTIALRGPGRWSYVYGNLSASDAEMLAESAALYRDTSDGLIPWRSRPEHLKRNCIARIPPADFPDPLEDQ